MYLSETDPMSHYHFLDRQFVLSGEGISGARCFGKRTAQTGASRHSTFARTQGTQAPEGFSTPARWRSDFALARTGHHEHTGYG